MEIKEVMNDLHSETYAEKEMPELPYPVSCPVWQVAQTAPSKIKPYERNLYL